ncbi:outer membrane beta-barrel protein [Kaistella palustris]|uniref:outer membrane beta-barrel protein n=1 Tax=Kaistella palustris TaxID=493376 RepID=UPI00040AEA7B|nr:outer membrane beta-barrel protein [Kaistella palustris]
MINKIIMSGFVCLLCSAISAQNININLQSRENTEVSPLVKEKVEEYAAKINVIIQEEKRMMEAELAVLQAKHPAQNDFETQKAAIADRYSEKIDARIEALGFDLDSVIQKQVRYSLLNSDAKSDEEIKANLLKKFQATKNLTGYFSYGIMMLTNNLPDNVLDENIGYSNNLEFGLKYNYQFSRTSAWGFTSGIGFSWRTVRLENNKIFAKDPILDVNVVDYGGNTSKSKLRTGYLMVPVGLQYNFSKIKNAGMDIQYRSYSDGFRIAAQMYGGVKMSSNNIVRGNGDDYRHRENFQVNPFIYGAQLTFSYNDLSLFVKKDFSNFFEKGAFNNDKALVIGLALGL